MAHHEPPTHHESFPDQHLKPRTVIGLPKPSGKIIRTPNGTLVHAVESIGDMLDHLQTALCLEWATIPLYLFGRYSLTPGSYAGMGPGELIRSVVQEEMLHLVLAANMLTAIGGTPKLYSYQPFPIFPVAMPHHSNNFILSLRPADLAQIQLYCAVELPAAANAPPQPDNYDTIGQFYEAIIQGFMQLGKAFFNPNSLQYQIWGPDGVYSGKETGGLMQITDVNSAVAACNLIIGQGEGNNQTEFVDPNDTEVAHYFRFRSILQQGAQADTLNVLSNPLTSKIPSNTGQYAISRLFDACYSFLLLAIERTYTISSVTQADKRAWTTAIYIEFMTNVIRRISVCLVQQPYPGVPNTLCAPAFNLFDFYKEGGNTPPLAQIKALLQNVLKIYGPNGLPLLSPLVDILNGFHDLDPAPKLPAYTLPTE